MSAHGGTLRLDDHVHEVLEARLAPDLRFRASLITSLAMHVGAALAVFLAPMLLSRRLVIPPAMPVRMVSMQEAAALQAPPPEAEPEPEPPAVVVTDPEPVPRNLEALRRARREAEMEERRKAEEEERRRREEEERLKNQSARRSTSRQPEQRTVSQSAERGTVGFAGTERATGLTDEDFEFSYYLEHIVARILPRWSPPPSGAYGSNLSTLVYFRIDRSGRVFVGPEVRRASGNQLFDQAAVRAIRGITFAPLPQGYEGSSLGVHLEFKQQ